MYGLVPTTPPTIFFTNPGTSAMTSTLSTRSPRGPSNVALTSFPSLVFPPQRNLTAPGSGQSFSGSSLITVCVAELLQPAVRISVSVAIPPTLTTVDPYDGG